LVTLNSDLPSLRSSDAKSRSRSRPGCCRESREDLAVRCSSYPSYSVVKVLREAGRMARPRWTRGPA
jgi:hypothetical protein